MNADELKRYDAYPLLIAALKDVLENASDRDDYWGTGKRAEAAEKAARDLLKALGE